MRTVRYGGRLGLLTKTITTAAVSTALLAACSGNTPEPSEPRDPPSASEPGKPSKTPTPTRSLSEDEKRLAAIDSATKFLRATNRATQTLDPAPFLAMSTADCENCRLLAEHLRKTKNNGGRFEGEFEEHFIGARAERDMKPPKVTIDVSTGKWQYFSKPGAKAEVTKAKAYYIVYDMKWEGGKWLVAEFTPHEN